MTTMANVAAAEQRVVVMDGAVENQGATVVKNLLLFALAPFIGLAYIVAFPFIGTAALLRALLQG